jgi:hypothetical protein
MKLSDELDHCFYKYIFWFHSVIDMQAWGLCSRAAPADTPGRHDDRSATHVAGLGQEGAGNARPTTSQEARSWS